MSRATLTSWMKDPVDSLKSYMVTEVPQASGKDMVSSA